MGFDDVWTSEHHFVEDGYLAGSFAACAAIAARTSRVRIGTNVVLLPLHDPLRVAEDAVTVDLLSGERFDLGVAVGHRTAEFAAFGVEARARRPDGDRNRPARRRVRGAAGRPRRRERGRPQLPSRAAPAPGPDAAPGRRHEPRRRFPGGALRDRPARVRTPGALPGRRGHRRPGAHDLSRGAGATRPDRARRRARSRFRLHQPRSRPRRGRTSPTSSTVARSTSAGSRRRA